MMKRSIVFLVMIMILGEGCTSYHRMPLDPEVVAGKLAPPGMADLRIQAQRIKHPILKPVELTEEHGLSPDEAAILAVLVNPGLRAERDKRGLSTAQLYQAGILPNPDISLNWQVPTGGSTEGAVVAYGLGISYDIRALVTRGAEIDAAQAKASSVSLDVAWQEWQIAEAAKLNAYRVILLQQQLGVAKEEEDALRQNLDVVKKAVDLGDLTIINLSASRASLEKVHLSVLDIEQNLEQEHLALNRSIGFAPDYAVRLREGIELPSPESVPSAPELLTGIEERRLDLLALKMGYESQEAHVRAAILGQFPKISMGFTQARDNTNVISSGPAITISFPVFDRNQGQIAIERATRQQLFDEYRARFFDAQSELAKLRSNLDSVQREIAATQAYLPTLRRLVEAYYSALLEGNADVLTYYIARDDLIATQIALLGLQLQLVDQFVALEIAAGEYLGLAQSKEAVE